MKGPIGPPTNPVIPGNARPGWGPQLPQQPLRNGDEAGAMVTIHDRADEPGPRRPGERGGASLSESEWRMASKSAA